MTRGGFEIGDVHGQFDEWRTGTVETVDAAGRRQ